MLLKRVSQLFLVSVALLLPAQTAHPREESTITQIAVINARLETLVTLDARVGKLSDKIDGLSQQVSDLKSDMSSIKTELRLIEWIGATLGALLIASLYAQFTNRSRPESQYITKDELIKILATK